MKQLKKQIVKLLSYIFPPKCPFERDIIVLGKTYHIPAICKLNPLYEDILEYRLETLRKKS